MLSFLAFSSLPFSSFYFLLSFFLSLSLSLALSTTSLQSIRRELRHSFFADATITTRATPKGRREVEDWSPYAPFRYQLKKKDEKERGIGKVVDDFSAIASAQLCFFSPNSPPFFSFCFFFPFFLSPLFLSLLHLSYLTGKPVNRLVNGEFAWIVKAEKEVCVYERE